MTLISYAQNFEDVVLWRALGHCSPGRYIDIGAQDPVVDSVSRAFFNAGWRGIHVEPVAAYAAALREAYPTDKVIEAAASKTEGSLTLYELPGSGLSTARADIAQFHLDNFGHVTKVCEVKATTLATIFEELGEGPIHWLKIDVEGFEREVLEGWGDARQRPWVVLIESTFPTTDRPMHDDWENLVITRDYELAYTDGLNRFYLHKLHRDLRDKFRHPPNVFDDFELSGTATWLTTGLVRKHREKEAEQSDRIDQLAKMLEELKLARTTQEQKLVELKQQGKLEQRSHAEEVERLRAARNGLEALQWVAQRLEVELQLARTESGIAQEQRLLAQEKAEAVLAEAAILREELAVAVASKEAVLADMVRAAERADAAAAEIATMREQFDAMVEDRAIVVASLDLIRSERDRLQQRATDAVADNYALSMALQERAASAQDLALQMDQQAIQIAELEARQHRQANQAVARAYALHMAEAEAEARRVEAIRLGKELSRKAADLEQVEHLISAFRRELERLTSEMNESSWIGLLKRLGLFRIDTSRAAALGQQAALLLEKSEMEFAQLLASEFQGEHNAMSRILLKDVSELLIIGGAELVDMAYRTLLKRTPDRAGREHFLERLRAGDGKEAVVLAIANSPEARALPDSLGGLADLRARQARRRGSRFIRTEVTPLERTLNRLEFAFGEMHVRASKQSDQILARLDHLEEQINVLSARGGMPPSGASESAGAAKANFTPQRPISNLTGQISDTAPTRFIEQLRAAVRHSAEAATIADNRF